MGGTIYGIAAAALVHANGGSGGVFRRVKIHFGVITRTKRGIVCDIATATMSTPNGGAVIRREEIGVGVSSRVDEVNLSK